MNILEILQTIGICLSSVFLLLITLMLFQLGSAMLPPTAEELEELMEDEMSEHEAIIYLRGRSREEIAELLRTPVPPSSKNQQSKRRKK